MSFPSLALRRPFLVFAAVYAAVFAVGFSFLANFGILARQRTQMMPMLLVLLALPAYETVKQRSAARRADEEDDPSSAESELATLTASVADEHAPSGGARSGV